jgi:hypothetical protein
MVMEAGSAAGMVAVDDEGYGLMQLNMYQDVQFCCPWAAVHEKELQKSQRR